MIALIQRVGSASVEIEGRRVASIGVGLLALVGVERGDSETEAGRLANRIVRYRVFEDAERKMNLSLLEISGDLLIVPQFTLAADTKQGTRPGFSRAASPDDGRRLFDLFVKKATQGTKVETGQFGADMKVSLVNDGPVTFWLQVSPPRGS